MEEVFSASETSTGSLIAGDDFLARDVGRIDLRDHNSFEVDYVNIIIQLQWSVKE